MKERKYEWLVIAAPYARRLGRLIVALLLGVLLGLEQAALITGLDADALRQCALLFSLPPHLQ